MHLTQLFPAAVLLLQWRANRYPGCACDVSSVMYCYSFEPYPWTQLYSEQKEILQYLHHCAGENTPPIVHAVTGLLEGWWLQQHAQQQQRHGLDLLHVHTSALMSKHVPVCDWPCDTKCCSRAYGGTVW